jgi:hypothetical protein
VFVLLIGSLQVLHEMGSNVGGRSVIRKAMKLCPDTPLENITHVIALRDYLASAW